MFNNIKFNKNTEGRDFFIGDLHGCYEHFISALFKVNFDSTVDRVFSVGDLIDRGPDSEKCLDLLKEPWFHAVKGNHEDFLLGSHTEHVWYYNGGDWALNCDKLDFYRDLVKKKMHRTITVDTEYGSVGVVHAESDEDWNNNSDTTGERNSWARSKFKTRDNTVIKNIDKVIVGHTPLKQIVQLGNVIYIDTGAVFNGSLTILSVEDIFFGKYKILK